MYTGQATWFSPDGNYLAFASFDDTLVETYSYYYYVDKTDPDDLYPELYDLKYPKVNFSATYLRASGVANVYKLRQLLTVR